MKGSFVIRFTVMISPDDVILAMQFLSLLFRITTGVVGGVTAAVADDGVIKNELL